MVMQCLLSGHKVIACGVARSYANAQFLVSNLLNRYDFRRPSLPSVNLNLESAVGSSLVLINLSINCININLAYRKTWRFIDSLAPLGTEKRVLNTIANAVNKEIQIIALTGANNDAIQGVLAEADLEISIPATKARILENHLFVINALCRLVDSTLFPRA